MKNHLQQAEQISERTEFNEAIHAIYEEYCNQKKGTFGLYMSQRILGKQVEALMNDDITTFLIQTLFQDLTSVQGLEGLVKRYTSVSESEKVTLEGSILKTERTMYQGSIRLQQEHDLGEPLLRKIQHLEKIYDDIDGEARIKAINDILLKATCKLSWTSYAAQAWDRGGDVHPNAFSYLYTVEYHAEYWNTILATAMENLNMIANLEEPETLIDYEQLIYKLEDARCSVQHRDDYGPLICIGLIQALITRDDNLKDSLHMLVYSDYLLNFHIKELSERLETRMRIEEHLPD